MTDRKRGIKNLLVFRAVHQKRKHVFDIRLRFNDGKTLTSVDCLTASGMYQAYGKLNREGKRKFVDLMGKSKGSFFYIANWTWKHLTLKTV